MHESHPHSGAQFTLKGVRAKQAKPSTQEQARRFQE
jgi:hypothetical protein